MVLEYSKAAISICVHLDMNGRVCGALVQCLCLSPIHIRLSLEVSCLA